MEPQLCNLQTGRVGVERTAASSELSELYAFFMKETFFVESVLLETSTFGIVVKILLLLLCPHDCLKSK